MREVGMRVQLSAVMAGFFLLFTVTGCGDDGSTPPPDDAGPMDAGDAGNGDGDGGGDDGGGDAGPGERDPADCNPLDPARCTLPFPSQYYLEEDSSTNTGLRVSYGPTSLPENKNGEFVDPRFWNEKDGYSMHSPMLAFFEGVTLEGAVTHENIGDYTADDVKTVVVDTETGERLPHWVELDATAPSSDEMLLIIRPAVPMEYDTRYVVGIRGLVKDDGSPVDVSPAFAALRDDDSSDDERVEAMRARFDSDVFPVLEDQGFARDELQLAWDFHTMSRWSSLGQALTAREDLLETLPADGPAYTIETMEDGDCAGGDTIGRTIEGTMEVPLYTEEDEPGTLLTRDDDGLPVQNGTTDVGFLIRIPCSLTTAPAPSRILQYGHGLFGSRGEAKTGYLGQMADDFGYVIFAVDWKGMRAEDSTAIAITIGMEPGHFAQLPERSIQGMMEQISAMKMMRGAMADDDVVKFDDGSGTMVSVIDPDQIGYYGNSQGGILGGAYLGLSPDLERGVLGVGGMPYSVLLPRSKDFDPFFGILKAWYPNHIDRMIFVAGLLQQLWDMGEGAGYAHDFNEDPPEGMPEKQALLQVAIGDVQVTTLGAQIQARAFNANTVMPETRDVWGVEEREPGFTGSALVEWEYDDLPPEPFEARPPENEDPHECPRRNEAAQMQLRDFIETGVVNHYCDGRCTDTQADCR
ncbi:MAG: hypothetical protein ACOCUS_00575 [Polyangiales bacterium]